MKGYGEYKKTTYDWLPIVPAHWDHITIRSLMQPSDIRCGMRSDLELLSVYREYGVIKKISRDDNHNKPSLDISNYKYVGRNFVVMNKMKMWQGSLGVSAFEGIVSPAYIVCTVRKELNFNYLNYLLRSHPFRTFYNRISYGIRVGQWDLRYDDLKTLNLFLPPREEQDQIVRYLDAKVGKINKLIKIKQQQIALLKEKKQVIINQAVTKGLDPNTPMKDSGIAWIGQIPKRWEITLLKKIATIQSGITLGKTYHSSNMQTYPYMCVANVQNGFLDLSNIKNIQVPEHEASRYMLQKNDVLMTEGGDPDKLGRGCLWHGELDNCLHQNHIFAVRSDSTQILSEYLCLFLSSSFSQYYFLITSKQTTNLASTNKTKLRALPIPLPNIEEQKNILTQLQKELSKYEALATACEHKISSLTEYRTRLISDVVTGKVDVRDLAVPETCEEDQESATGGHPWLAQEDENEYSVDDMEKQPE